MIYHTIQKASVSNSRAIMADSFILTENTQQLDLEVPVNEIETQDDCMETDSADKSASPNKVEPCSSELQEIDPESAAVNEEGSKHVDGIANSLEDTDMMQENLDVAETTQVVEETEVTEEEILHGRNSTARLNELIQKLGYLPMTLQIFQKMRDTFGTEECEYCGRLFFSQVDYEPHVRTHTGKSFNFFPNKPWFLHVFSTSLLKTLRERGKLHVPPFWRTFCHFYRS